MLFALPPRRTLIEIAETLAIALAGGLAFALLGLPAGLVSGSVLAVATAALLGRPVKVPLALARVCYVVVGILLGAVVTPETLRGVTTWPASIALLMLASLGMMLATSLYLRVVHRWDPLSALMGASPGSMAQVIALSTELGGDLRAIAIVQTVRILLLVIGLPNGLALFGLVVPAVAAARGPAGISVLGEMILLAVVASVFAVAFLRLRFPGGLLFGAMAGSAILHGTGLIHAVLPWWIGSSAVVVLGGVVGSRFANTTLRDAGRLSRRRVRLICGVDGGGDVLRADRGAFLSVSDRQHRHRVCAWRAGHDDGAGARAAPRSGLCRRPSSGALSRGHFLGGHRRAPHGAAKIRRRAIGSGGDSWPYRSVWLSTSAR